MNSRSGNAYITSVKRIRMLSVRPPNQPAIAPSGTPITRMTIWTTMATVMLDPVPRQADG